MRIKSRNMCEVCQKTFQCKSTLAIHYRIHTGDRPYKCKQCLKTFVQLGHLLQHIKTHTGPGEFKCKVCPKCFHYKSQLQNHILHCHRGLSVCNNFVHVKKPEVVEGNTGSISHRSPLCKKVGSYEIMQNQATSLSNAEGSGGKKILNKAIQSKEENDRKGVSVGNDTVNVKKSDTVEEKAGSEVFRDVPSKKAQSMSFPFLQDEAAAVSVVNGSDGKRKLRKPFSRRQQDHRKTNANMCHSCGKRYTQRVFLIRHMYMHHGKKDSHSSRHGAVPGKEDSYWGVYKHKCPLCSRRYTKVYNMTRHIRLNHKKNISQRIRLPNSSHPNTGKCSSDQEEDSRLNNNSIKKSHSQCITSPSRKRSEGKFNTNCKTFLDGKASIKESENRTSSKSCPSSLQVNTKVHAFRCDLCGKTYAQRGYLRRHIIISHGKPPKQHGASLDEITHNWERHLHKCPLCTKRYTRAYNLERHMRTQHKNKALQRNPLPQSACSDDYSSKDKAVGIYKNFQTRKIPVKRFTCPVCDKEVVDLNRHFRVHTLEKPYHCPCGSSFSAFNNLQRHMRIHTDSKSSLFIKRFDKQEIPKFAKDLESTINIKPLSRMVNQNSAQMNAQLEIKDSPSDEIKQYPFHCSCGARFSSQLLLRRHVQRHLTEGSRLFIQNFDPGTVQSLFSTTFHKQKLCKSEKQRENDHSFKCKFCDHHFDHAYRLKTHMRNSHSQTVDDTKKPEDWKCKVCGERFHLVRSYTRHLQFHTDPHSRLYIKTVNPKKQIEVKEARISYSCRFCNKTFPSSTLYRHHMKCHSKRVSQHPFRQKEKRRTANMIRCLVCKRNFKDKQFQLHLRSHTAIKPHVCELCHKGFDQIGNLNKHKETHMPNQTYKCRPCSRYLKLTHRDKLSHSADEKSVKQKNHSLQSSENDKEFIKFKPKPFRCTHCNKTFGTKHDLQRHIRLKHQSLLGTECDTTNNNDCSKYVWNRREQTSSSYPKSRRKRKPNNDWAPYKPKKYVCTICGKRCMTIDCLTLHCRVHTNERPFVCPVCAFPFKQKAHLHTHLKTVHSFTKSRIRSHMREGLKEVVGSNCKTTTTVCRRMTRLQHDINRDVEQTDVCHDQKKLKRQNLKSAVVVSKSRSNQRVNRIKSKAKRVLKKPRFECIVCEKVFTTRPMLDVHLRIHTGDLPFKCDICHKKFIHATNRNDHVERMHKGKGKLSWTDKTDDDGEAVAQSDSTDMICASVVFNEVKDSVSLNERCTFVHSEDDVTDSRRQANVIKKEVFCDYYIKKKEENVIIIDDDDDDDDDDEEKTAYKPVNNQCNTDSFIRSSKNLSALQDVDHKVVTKERELLEMAAYVYFNEGVPKVEKVEAAQPYLGQYGPSGEHVLLDTQLTGNNEVFQPGSLVCSEFPQGVGKYEESSTAVDQGSVVLLSCSDISAVNAEQQTVDRSHCNDAVSLAGISRGDSYPVINHHEAIPSCETTKRQSLVLEGTYPVGSGGRVQSYSVELNDPDDDVIIIDDDEESINYTDHSPHLLQRRIKIEQGSEEYYL